MTSALTMELAEFAAGLERSDLPDAVVDKVMLHTLDQIGAELAGATQHWNRIVREYAVEESPPGAATVIGSTSTARPEWAALANATAGHGFEIDDYHAEALSHPGAVAVPTVIALGEHLDSSGEDALVALAIGFEVIIRLGLAMQPSLIYDRGFHETCVGGVLGGALAAGRLLGLGPGAMAGALGIAGSHASGTTEYSRSGSEVKRYHAGLGAAGAIRAAALSGRGFEGPHTILEGGRGILQAFTDQANGDALVTGLGTKWHLLDAAIKPYCCCGLIHAPIDAVLALMREDGLEAGDVDEIVVGADHLSLVHVGKIGPRPRDMTGAQFSMEFSLGMTLTLGGNGFSHYRQAEAAGFADPATLEVADRVRLELDEAADAAFPASFLARVRVRTKRGAVLERAAYATGSPDAPMSGEDVRVKFRDIAAATLEGVPGGELEAGVDRLVAGGSVTGILSGLRQGPDG